MHEAQLHDDCCFITMTYRDEDLPENGTLVKRDLQLFMKRLRSAVAPIRFKFFACGEYGEKLSRPHYHAILLGYRFPDLVPMKRKARSLGRSAGSEYSSYYSEKLEALWEKGFCDVGDVSFESASYVAQYSMKKITNKVGRRDEDGRYHPSMDEHYGRKIPEFCLMSRGGTNGKGLAHGWIDRYRQDVYPADEVIVRGKRAKPPRYYDTAVEEDYSRREEEMMQGVKERRQKAGDVGERTLLKGHVYKPHPAINTIRLRAKENCALARAKKSRRSMEEGHEDHVRGA